MHYLRAQPASPRSSSILLLVQSSRQPAVRKAHVCYTTVTNGRSRRSKRATTRSPSSEELQQQPNSSTAPPAEQLYPETSLAAASPISDPLLNPRYAEAQSWLVFSDLHMSAKTQDTAMEVLERVRREATKRAAGVLFLGDFWDRRGDLPVVPLNRVQQELRQWDMPLLLLPGNHDQVDLGGQEHSLFSLQIAAPCAHVFTHPAVFRDALWLPYRRNESDVRSAIQHALQHRPLKAIFAHADVLTAHMNAAYQARDGLAPGLFPQNIPVYMGHYHYPHTVEGTSITYVGSPFQVSASEAGQQKRLLLLDSNWQQTGEIPLDIGRKFFTFSAPGTTALTTSSSSDSDCDAASASETSGTMGTEGGLAVAKLAQGPASFLLDPEVVQKMIREGVLKCGDVVKLEATEETAALLQVQKLLQKSGVQVQLHLRPSASPVARIKSAEQLSMQQLLEQYATNTGMSEEVLSLARGALQMLGSRSSETPTHSHLQLQQVTVEGFGPFRGAVTYPLADRGVVAVTGRNEDDAAAVSNGAGKTSLLTALLWAFKAPDGRGLTSADYVNEDSKRATVKVTGIVNQEPFELIRSVTGGRQPRSSLKLFLNGTEVTSQEQRLTEQLLEQSFSASLLPKTLVFTQESLLALLQSGDAAFKDFLSSIVDTNAWADAREHAVSSVSAIRDQLRGQEVLAGSIQEDVAMTSRRLQELQDLVLSWEKQQKQQQDVAQQQEQVSMYNVLDAARGIAVLQQQLAAAAVQIAAKQRQLQADKAKAHASAAATAAALAAKADSEQQQQQQDTAPETSQQQQQQVDLVEFDEVAAAAALEPLTAAEEASRLQLQQQQALGQQLRGELAALNARRQKYEKLQGSSSSSSNGGLGVGSKQQGLSPVCEQCLQPINLDLYKRNLDSMAAEAQQLQQQLTESLQLEQQYRQVCSEAQVATRALLTQHAAQRAEITAENQRRMVQMRNAQEAAAQAARERDAAVRARVRQQQQEREQLQQRIWEEDRRLERELNLLQQLGSNLTAVQAKLQSTLARAAAKSQLQLQQTVESSNSSSSATADLQLLFSQLNAQADRLCDVITDSVDSLIGARSTLQQLSVQQNPHASGVSQWQQLLQQKQQQLEKVQEDQEALSKQLGLWRRVELTFGRTGIPSFILEEALGELQEACSRHLGQLAAGMTLELSATSEKKAGKKSSKAKKATATGSKIASTQGRTAAVAAAGSTPVGSVESDALSAVSHPADQSNLGSDGETLDISAAAADQKEEIAKIVRVRAAGGEMRQRSIAQLSGGEKKRVALALGLGAAELVAARSRLKSNVLVLDEVLEKLDEEGCICVAQLLKSLPYSSVFVVGQAGSFVTKEFASVDTVVKAGGCATVEIGATQAAARS